VLLRDVVVNRLMSLTWSTGAEMRQRYSELSG